jgi:hypothetical protein
MPQNFPTPQLKASIGTRSQNKNVHPGKPVLDAKQSRCSKQEMDEVRAQKAEQAGQEKVRLVKGLKAAAQIEDDLVQEDIHRRTSNRRSEGITPFNPHLRAVGTGVAKPSSPSLSAASGHNSTECGLSFSSIIRKECITIPVDDATHKTAYDEYNEGSAGSQDEFQPPPCEDEVSTSNESEADASESDNEKKKTKKGKKPKPGRKDVATVRETIAQKPTPTSTEDRLKRKADDATSR